MRLPRPTLAGGGSAQKKLPLTIDAPGAGSGFTCGLRSSMTRNCARRLIDTNALPSCQPQHAQSTVSKARLLVLRPGPQKDKRFQLEGEHLLACSFEATGRTTP
jgi:hypothetical protein